MSLEPCSTHGKTPPCAEALAAAGVARVVWAAADPNPANRGKAKRRLASLGIAATGPVLPDAGEDLLVPFRRGLRARRPWVILKWASSLDGRIAAAQGTGGPLSGARAARYVHDLRRRSEAVAVGVGTVLVDDPRLTARDPKGVVRGRQPIAVVFDSQLRTPSGAQVVTGSSEARPLVLYAARPRADRVRRFSGLSGVRVVEVPDRDGRVDLSRALADLRRRGVRRLLVEGGSTLAGALLAAGLVDQVAAILCPVLLGADGAPTALSGTGIDDLSRAVRLHPARARALGRDLLVEGLVSA